MEYHVGRDQQQLGKFTEQQIREGLFDGRFLKTDLLWHEGMDGWKPVADVLSTSSADVVPPASEPAAPPPAPAFTPTAPTFSAPPSGPPPAPFGSPAGFGGVGPIATGARPTSGTAIASLVLGIVSLIGILCYIGLFTGVAGIICGHLALGSIKRSNKTLDGKGLAIAGLVLNYLSVLISIVVIGFLILLMTAHGTGITPDSTDTTPTEFPATSTPVAE